MLLLLLVLLLLLWWLFVIYADDVVCAHGATVGELDDDQLFYCLQRGINEEDAVALSPDIGQKKYRSEATRLETFQSWRFSNPKPAEMANAPLPRCTAGNVSISPGSSPTVSALSYPSAPVHPRPPKEGPQEGSQLQP
mgnify:CR=1 FL=1